MSLPVLQHPDVAPSRSYRPGAVLVVTCIALATVVSAMASLNVALPSLATELHASQTNLSWVVGAYSLVFASLLLVGGMLGDRFGRRRVLVAGLVLFAAGSAAAPFTTNIHLLIGLRALLGVGAAMVMPATLSTITTTFPVQRRAFAVSVWAGVGGASALVGLLLSGLLLEQWSWRAVFVLNVVLAVTALVGTWLVVPTSVDPRAPRIDFIGAGLVVVGVGSLVYSVIEAPNRGWLDPWTLGGIAVGLGVLAVFVVVELHSSHPLLDPRLFKVPAFTAGALSIFLQFFAFFGFIFVVMQYLQLIRGDSPLMAAVSVLPSTAGMLIATRGSVVLSGRIGQRACGVLGLLLVTTGLLVLAQLDGASSYWLLVAGLVPMGSGMGLAMTPATSAITASLPVQMQGVGSGMNDLARELGGALGVAVLGSLLTTTYQNSLSLSGPVAEQARSFLGVAIHIGGPVLVAAQSAFIDGMRVALTAAAGVTAVAAILVAVLLRPRGGATVEADVVRAEDQATRVLERTAS